MAKHLVENTGCLKAYQKRFQELAATRWIQLKMTGSNRRGQKELILTQLVKRFSSAQKFQEPAPQIWSQPLGL
jgi:hypothetical protein